MISRLRRVMKITYLEIETHNSRREREKEDE